MFSHQKAEIQTLVRQHICYTKEIQQKYTKQNTWIPNPDFLRVSMINFQGLLPPFHVFVILSQANDPIFSRGQSLARDDDTQDPGGGDRYRVHPGKSHFEPKNGGLFGSDDIPFQLGDF